MKRWLIVVMLLSASMSWAAEGWLYHDYAKGQAMAKKENKPIMLMIHTAGCPECQYMEEVVFMDSETHAYMKENFINIAVDFKKDKYPKQYTHFGVPHVYFTDADGKVLDQQIGGTRGDRFLKKLQQAKAKLGS